MVEGPLCPLDHIKLGGIRWKCFPFFLLPTSYFCLSSAYVGHLGDFQMVKMKIDHLFYGNTRKTEKGN